MGTRSLTCVYYKGRYQIVQHGRYDGYPSHEGLCNLHFLRKEGNQRKLKEALDNGMIYRVTNEHCDLVRREHHAEYWQVDGTAATPYQDFPFPYATLQSNVGSMVLKLIAMATEPVPVCLCEIYHTDVLWVYVIDFDKGTFEVFGAGDVARECGRSVRHNKRFRRKDGRNEYSPIALWRLHNLPRSEAFEAYFGEHYN